MYSMEGSRNNGNESREEKRVDKSVTPGADTRHCECVGNEATHNAEGKHTWGNYC